MSLLSLLRAYITRETLKTLRRLLNLILSPFHFFITMAQAEAQPEPQIQVQSQDPPPFDPSKPSVPISYPIKTLKDLKSRVYFDSFHYPFNKSSVLLPNAAFQLPNRRRILVCHDMQGGYVDDKWAQGGTNADSYAIWHWYLMDIFVYFSHNLVTLPPPCWTNTAHRHGVKVLGTFILEWDEGRIMANELLSTKESTHLYAERLAELASKLGFDGWLLNMEVELDVKQIPNMKEFISHLTQTMHSLVQGSLVIWKTTRSFQQAVAGDRRYDVYMGIDVFGRSTYGGGKWNTNVALDLLRKDDVSAAIFAPGWVYETKQPPDFETAQNRWWSLVEKSWGILQKYPKALPFYTNFDQGRGLHISIEGGQVSNASWNNISSQGFQPFLKFNDDPNSDTIQVLVE
ncbi:hypothetical protein Pint_06578 [Pistacia integerrima]|uniref:Uncharacterized protein n=1 Tax=Pistacia integerrima TaxID=434235 RepID=A0ACC0Z7P9_9ROSI|nr:hypothetical protein Pint_06578 [Pistacia integerrima]